MAARYHWVTGPISSSLGLDHIMVDVLNNTHVSRSVRIDVYDLSAGSPSLVFTRIITIEPFADVNEQIPIKDSSVWEVHVITSSKKIRLWVGGQDEGGMNLDGNVILSSQFQLI